jgi:cell division protein FtsL
MNNRKIIIKNSRNSSGQKLGWTRRVTSIKKRNVLIIILVISTICLEMVNIFLTNSMDTDSILASQLQQEVAVMNRENNIVRAKVYELSSYESVASRAAEFGFKEAGNVISLDTPVQVARQ